MDQGGTLDPKLDVVFKMLFGRLENRGLLISLLEAVLGVPSPIRSVHVESELGKNSVDDKGVVLDLRVELSDGQHIDVEMQTQPRPARRERALYYWAKMYAGQLGRGQGYRELRRCVVVLILAFSELPGSRFHSIFRVSEPVTRVDLCDHLELHLLELPKLELAPSDEPELSKWGKFLRASTDDEREVLAMSDPVLRKAKTALEELSADPEARLAAEMRDLALKSYELDLSKARTEGQAEGRAQGQAEGRAQGQAEALLSLLTVKFGEPPPEAVERLRTATEDDRRRWLGRILGAESLSAVFDEP